MPTYRNQSINSIIHKDIFACLFSIHNIIISLSCHEQVCLSGLRFERYFSHHRARWWEKYLSKRSPLKHTCSWHDKLIIIIIIKLIQLTDFYRMATLVFSEFSKNLKSTHDNPVRSLFLVTQDLIIKCSKVCEMKWNMFYSLTHFLVSFWILNYFQYSTFH